jgi:hypothetical protein
MSPTNESDCLFADCYSNGVIDAVRMTPIGYLDPRFPAQALSL